SCANFSHSGIVLFEHANCSGNQLIFNGASSWVNLSSYSWNDRASSVYIPSGWSLLVYEHNDGGGASRCLPGVMWDFNLDYFHNSSVKINDAISSAHAFTNNSCTSPGSFDLRQNGAIEVSGNLVEGGTVFL